MIYKMKVLVSGQLINERAIEVQMKVTPSKAKAYFREMKERYGTSLWCYTWPCSSVPLTY